MPLSIPPAGIVPESARLSYGTLPMLVPPSIPFPREPMQPALDVHRRIVGSNLHWLLHEVIEPEQVESGIPFCCLDSCVPILMEDPGGTLSLAVGSRARASWRRSTRWSGPAKTASGQGEVEIPAEPRTLRERVDATLEHHAASILREHRCWLDRGVSDPSYLFVRNRKHVGFTVHGLPLGKDCVDCWVRESRPNIRRELLRRRPGFDPVYFDVDYGGGVRWIPRSAGVDSQVPAGIDELDVDAGE